jgi:hypothetical protein
MRQIQLIRELRNLLRAFPGTSSTRVRSGKSANPWPGPTGTVRKSAVILFIAFATTHGSAQKSSIAHLWKDPAAKAYSCKGLPCSTAQLSGSSIWKAPSPLQQLDQIERQSLSMFKGADHVSGTNTSFYRVADTPPIRPPSINFVYHAPAAGGRSR